MCLCQPVGNPIDRLKHLPRLGSKGLGLGIQKSCYNRGIRFYSPNSRVTTITIIILLYNSQIMFNKTCPYYIVRILYCIILFIYFLCFIITTIFFK